MNTNLNTNIYTNPDDHAGVGFDVCADRRPALPAATIRHPYCSGFLNRSGCFLVTNAGGQITSRLNIIQE